MKLDRQKLYNAIAYINEINSNKFLEMDFSELFDNKKDLSFKQKNELFWGYERMSNLEIIQKIMKDNLVNSISNKK